ncbi:MAG TPA: hypothetical protein VFI41_12535 [Gemmatimonadales bacterium]|nr:hypothetical protein [Gemmatimonadales bacterium]
MTDITVLERRVQEALEHIRLTMQGNTKACGFAEDEPCEYCQRDLDALLTAPPGLDLKAAVAASFATETEEMSPFKVSARAFRALNAQHVAVLAHARAEAKRETVEEIVKAVRECVEDTHGVPFSGLDLPVVSAVADFIAARFGRET